jgi:hypothetical protein
VARRGDRRESSGLGGGAAGRMGPGRVLGARDAPHRLAWKGAPRKPYSGEGGIQAAGSSARAGLEEVNVSTPAASKPTSSPTWARWTSSPRRRTCWSGTGTTQLATRACQAGHRVLFATAAAWVTGLADAHHSGRTHDELRRPGRYRCSSSTRSATTLAPRGRQPVRPARHQSLRADLAHRHGFPVMSCIVERFAYLPLPVWSRTTENVRGSRCRRGPVGGYTRCSVRLPLA